MPGQGEARVADEGVRRALGRPRTHTPWLARCSHSAVTLCVTSDSGSHPEHASSNSTWSSMISVLRPGSWHPPSREKPRSSPQAKRRRRASTRSRAARGSCVRSRAHPRGTPGSNAHDIVLTSFRETAGGCRARNRLLLGPSRPPFRSRLDRCRRTFALLRQCRVFSRATLRQARRGRARACPGQTPTGCS
jgi:hypothetical protein